MKRTKQSEWIDLIRVIDSQEDRHDQKIKARLTRRSQLGLLDYESQANMIKDQGWAYIFNKARLKRSKINAGLTGFLIKFN